MRESSDLHKNLFKVNKSATAAQLRNFGRDGRVGILRFFLLAEFWAHLAQVVNERILSKTMPRVSRFDSQLTFSNANLNGDCS